MTGIAELTASQQQVKDRFPNASRQLLVYIGVRHGGKTKKVYGYVPITTEEWEHQQTMPDESKALWWKKSIYPGTPGSVVAVMIERNGEAVSIYNNGRQYMGRWSHLEHNVLWEAKHDEVRAEIEAGKDAMSDAILESLQPLAKAYRRASKTGRAALMVKVIRYIQAI